MGLGGMGKGVEDKGRVSDSFGWGEGDRGMGDGSGDIGEMLLFWLNEWVDRIEWERGVVRNNGWGWIVMGERGEERE